MIRILVVDDHPIVRAGIIGLLDIEADLEVVGEAESGEAALELVPQLTPDIVLMDLRMPGIGGAAATRQLLGGGSAHAASPLRVIVFTTYEDDDRILEAIEAGASGYLLKAGPAEQLIAGIRSVAAGQTVLAPRVISQLSRAATKPAMNERVALTPRESEALALIAQGYSNPEIAAHLGIGESTVKSHLLHLFSKLEVSDRTRAVTRAQELGLLPHSGLETY